MTVTDLFYQMELIENCFINTFNDLKGLCQLENMQAEVMQITSNN